MLVWWGSVVEGGKVRAAAVEEKFFKGKFGKGPSDN